MHCKMAKANFQYILKSCCYTLLVFVITSFNPSLSLKKQQRDDLIIKSIDPLVKVTPDFLPRSANETTTYAYARNEEVHIQLVVWNKPILSAFTINTKFAGIAPEVTYQKVGYVSIKQQADKIDNKVQSSTNQFPDPLFDTDNKAGIAANSVTSFWINFKIPTAAQSGIYPVTLTCTANIYGKAKRITKKIIISISKAVADIKNYPWLANWIIVDMPTLGPTTKKLRYLNNNIDVIPFNNNYWKKITNITSFMSVTGQNVYMMSPQRLAKYSYNGNALSIDFSRLDSMLDCYLKYKLIGRIDGWQICSRPGDFQSNYVIHYIKKDSLGRAVFANGQPEDADVQAFYKIYLPALIQHLKSKNLYDKYYQHIADEPIDANADSYIRIIKMIKNIVPDLKTLEPIQTTKVVPYLTVPIPQLDYLYKNSIYFENLVKQGKEVWFYTAFLPQDTYANRFIEQHAIMHRLLFWILAKYNMKGTLNWGFNYWDVPDVYNGLGRKSGQFILPAGDSWLVYPKPDGLITSIRMKTITDGMNDYALLQQLKQRNPELEKSLVDKVVINYKTYVTDIQAFRKVRTELLKALNN